MKFPLKIRIVADTDMYPPGQVRLRPGMLNHFPIRGFYKLTSGLGRIWWVKLRHILTWCAGSDWDVTRRCHCDR
jgi:hypothetical protein